MNSKFLLTNFITFMLFVSGLFSHVDQSPLNGVLHKKTALKYEQARKAGLTAYIVCFSPLPVNHHAYFSIYLGSTCYNKQYFLQFVDLLERS